MIDTLDTHHFLLSTTAHHVEILSSHLCQANDPERRCRRQRESNTGTCSGKLLKMQAADHVYPSVECPHHRALYSSSPATKEHLSLTTSSNILLNDFFTCIKTLIFFILKLCVQDKVQDARKDTDTHHFGNHGRTNTQGYRNLADCDPLVSVGTLDNDSTATSTVSCRPRSLDLSFPA